jgi:hypothetical protein
LQLTWLLDESAVSVRAGARPGGAVRPDPGELDLARKDARLSVGELYVAYLALGGTATSLTWPLTSAGSRESWTLTSETWQCTP